VRSYPSTLFARARFFGSWQVFRLRVARPIAFPSDPLRIEQWRLLRSTVPGLEPTHYGGAPAEELERTPLRTPLPFSPDPRSESEHLLHYRRLIHEVRYRDKTLNVDRKLGPIEPKHSDLQRFWVIRKN